MSLENIMVWLVPAIVIVLLASDRLASDAVALAGLLALIVTGNLSPDEALAGFSSPAVITIASLLVLSAALHRTGVVRWIADSIHTLAGNSERRLLLAGTFTPGLLSGLINIVATVSVFIPVLLRIALRAGLPPSRLLLPMATVAMAGANLTLIGASHNLVVNDILQQRTGEPFGFLEFMPVGAVMLGLATLYALTTARWLLRQQPVPDDGAEQTRDLIQRYTLDERIWELEVQPDSVLEKCEIGDLKLAEEYGLSLISLVHADHSRPRLQPDTQLKGGDILLLGGRKQRVQQAVANIEGLELHGAPAYRDDFSAGSAELIEVLVPPRSDAIGRSIKQLDLRARADLTAIALWRDGEPVRTDVETTALKAGDAILLYGNKRYTRGFQPEPEFHWLHPPQKQSAPVQQQKRLAPWTVLIFALVIISASLNVVSVAVAALTGALLVTLIGAVNAGQAYRAIEWRTLVLIAAMLPFATALNNSGASSQLAGWLTDTVGHHGPLAVMAVIATASLLLTQVLHNAAVAAVMTPVALDAAALMQVEPKAFALAVLVAASMSVLLPAGHPAPLLVRHNTDFSGADYARFGAPLAVLTLVVVLTVIPLLWPLTTGGG